MCIACHQLNMITGAAGYDQKGWRDLVTTMVALPEPQLNTVATYLATNFPEKPGRKPKLVAGDTTRHDQGVDRADAGTAAARSAADG